MWLSLGTLGEDLIVWREPIPITHSDSILQFAYKLCQNIYMLIIIISAQMTFEYNTLKLTVSGIPDRKTWIDFRLNWAKLTDFLNEKTSLPKKLNWDSCIYMRDPS